MRSQLLARSEATYNHYRFTLSNEIEGDRVLSYAPDGWDDDFEMERHQLFKGVIRKLSGVTLEFIKDGKDYIEQVYETQGVNGHITLLVERMNNDWEYERVYEYGIEMKTLKITEAVASVNLEDSNQVAKLINRRDMPVELFNTVDIDGRDIPELSTFYENTITLPDQANQSFSQLEWNGSIQTNDEWTAPPFVITSLARLELQNPTPGGTLKEQAFFREAQADYPGTRVELEYWVRVPVFAWLDSRLLHIDANDNIIRDYSLEFELIMNPSLSGGDVRTIDINTGDSLIFQVRHYESRIPREPSSEPLEFFTNFGKTPFIRMSGSQVDTLPAITSQGLLLYDVFERLILMTTGLMFRSSALGYQPNYPVDGHLFVAIMGKSFRGLDGGLNVTLKKLVESCFASLNLGLGIEGDEVVVEDMSYFYQSNVVLDLSGVVTEIEVSDDYFSTLEIGYDKFGEEAKYGLGEFNVKTSYSTPINTDKTRKIISPYRADTVGVIQLRSKPAGDDDNEDVSGDDDVFFIECVRDVDNLNARMTEGYDTAPDGWFNISISPARMARRHMVRDYLKHVQQPLRLQAKDRNSILQSQETGGASINENADIPVDELATPFIRPEYIMFSAPVARDLIDGLDIKGLVKVNDDLYGWVEKIKYSYKTEQAEFELIRADLDYITPVE